MPIVYGFNHQGIMIKLRAGFCKLEVCTRSCMFFKLGKIESVHNFSVRQKWEDLMSDLQHGISSRAKSPRRSKDEKRRSRSPKRTKEGRRRSKSRNRSKDGRRRSKSLSQESRSIRHEFLIFLLPR